MPIVITCRNGHRMKVDDKNAGRKVRCPSCQEVVAVPGAVSTPVRPVAASPAVPPPLPPKAPPPLPPPLPPRPAKKFDELERIPGEIEIDGTAYEMAASRQEFCQAMADRQRRALEIDLRKYPAERTRLARLFADTHGDSMDASVLLARAPLACRNCMAPLPASLGNRLVAEDEGTGDPLSPAKPKCKQCGSSDAYLLLEPKATARSGPRNLARDFAAAPRKAKNLGGSELHRQLVRARRGVGLHLVALIVSSIGYVLQLLMSFLALAAVRPADRISLSIGVIVISVLFVLTSAIARTAGSVLCLYAPERARAKGPALVSLIAGLIALWLHFAAIIVRDPIASVPFTLCAVPADLTSIIAFFVFLRRTANYLREWDAADRATKLIWFLISLTLLPFASAVSLRMMGDVPVAVYVIERLCWAGAQVWFWIVSGIAYSQVSRALGRKARSVD